MNWVGHKCSCHNQHVYMDVQKVFVVLLVATVLKVEILRRFSGIIFTCGDSVEAFSLLFNFNENIYKYNLKEQN